MEPCRRRVVVRSLVAAGCCTLGLGCSSGGGIGAPRATAPTATSTSSSTPTSPQSTKATTDSTPTTAATATCAAGRSTIGGAETTPPGDIPDSQAFITFTPKPARYTLEIPEGWARTDGANHEHFAQKLVAIDIRLVARPAQPTVTSVRAQEFATITKTATCAQLSDVTTVSRRAGTAIRLVYQADSTPDPVTGKVVRDDVELYEFWRAGTAAILTLSAPVGSDNVDVWRRVTDSFTWR